MRPFLLLLLMSGLLLSGCASQTVVKKRFFWPIGGLDPKIEYVNFYAVDRDVKHPESALAQAILGEEKGLPLFLSPHGVAIRDHDVFAVTDTGYGKVLVLDLLKGETRKLKSGDGEDYLFKVPTSVVYRGDGGGYVSDGSKGVIYAFNEKEVVVSEFGADDALNRPNGMAFDDKRQLLYVADTVNHQIAVFSAEGRLVKRIGKRGIGKVEFNYPLDVALAPTGEIVVLDALNTRVQILRPDGTFVRMFGERGTAAGSFEMPKAIAVDGFGHVYVTDGQAHRFVIFDLEGNFLLNIGSHSVVLDGEVHPGGLALPKGIAADAEGRILVVDSLNHMLHHYQFLSGDYLKKHPIAEGEAFIPEELR